MYRNGAPSDGVVVAGDDNNADEVAVVVVEVCEGGGDMVSEVIWGESRQASVYLLCGVWLCLGFWVVSKRELTRGHPVTLSS